jgi:hypothetical protein
MEVIKMAAEVRPSHSQRFLNFIRQEKNKTVLSSRRHIFIVSLVFLIIFMITKYSAFVAARFHISDSTAIQFHSVVAQSLAGLLALLIAFMLFSLQGAEQRLMVADQKLRSELRQLSVLAANSPARLRAIRDDLNGIVEAYSYLTLQQLSPNSSDRPSWEEVLEDFSRDYAALEEPPPSAVGSHMQSAKSVALWIWRFARVERHHNVRHQQDSVHLSQIFASLKGIEDALNAVGMQFITMVITQVLVETIVGFAVLLGASLVAVLLFGTVPISTLCPPLANAITVALLCWTLLTLLQLVRHTRDIYRDISQQIITPETE